jgi:hypothetical protein
MIKSASLHHLMETKDFVPQATIAHSIFDIAKQMHVKPEKGHDDLDEFYGCAFVLNEFAPFALMHYRGHPKDTTTIYLPYEFDSIHYITKLVGEIILELKIAPKEIIWQRSEKDLPQSQTPNAPKPKL